MPTTSISRELKSPSALATYAGLLVSIYGLATDKQTFVYWSLGAVVAILIYTALDRQRRYLAARNAHHAEITAHSKTRDELKEVTRQTRDRRRKICRCWHSVSHEIRDLTDYLRTGVDGIEAAELIRQRFEALLNHASTVFRELTGKECVASLMVPDDPRVETLRTKFYSFNVTPERKSHPSRPLPFTGGLVGKAFSTENVVCWTLGDQHFVPIRNDYSAFYSSGIVIPFKLGFRFAGVLNIDSVDPDVFTELEHKQPGCAFADALGAVMGIYELYMSKK
jgi:hypothetical protein